MGGSRWRVVATGAGSIQKTAGTRGPVVLVAVYLSFSIVWLLISDRLVAMWVLDPVAWSWIQNAKGWAYVAVSAVLLWIVSRRLMAEARIAHQSAATARISLAPCIEQLGGALLAIREGRRVVEYASGQFRATVGLREGDFIEDRIIEEDRRTLGGRDPATGFVSYRIRSATGVLRTMLELSSPDVGGGTPHAILLDITLVRALEDRARLENKMELLGQLAGGIAHDYNNILMVILGYAEMLRRRAELKPEHVAYVDQILEVSRRAADLTKRILQFGRQSSDQSGASIPEILSVPWKRCSAR